MKRALVLGSDRSRGALAGVRALGRAGWWVGVASPAPGGPAARSRYARAWQQVPLPGTEGAAFTDAIAEAIGSHGYDVLFAAGDDWMMGLSAVRDALRSLGAHVAHPPLETVLLCIDKQTLTAAASDAGLAVPRTTVATDAEIATWAGPAVVKSRLHWAPGLPARDRVEAVVAPTASAIALAVENIRAAGGDAVLQEPVYGELMALAGVFTDGRFLGRVQQRSDRVFPSMGISSRATTMDVDEALSEAVARMLIILGWSGLAQVQFLRGADGVPRLIDLNGRFYGSMALAEAAGVNLPDLLGRATLGQSPSGQGDARAGVRYIRLEGEVPRLVQGRLVREVAGTFRFAVGATQAVWDSRDPAPVLGQVTGRLRRLAQRR